MSLYSSGRTTGTVVDSGDGVTHTVPVYEGRSGSTVVVVARSEQTNRCMRLCTASCHSAAPHLELHRNAFNVCSHRA